MNIEKCRKKSAINIIDLSKMLRIDRRTYYNWIKNGTPIPSDKLIDLARIFNTTTDFLLGIETHESVVREVKTRIGFLDKGELAKLLDKQLDLLMNADDNEDQKLIHKSAKASIANNSGESVDG